MELLNQTLGKYKLTKLLGEGGMSYVYLAEHENLGSKVAIKLLKSDFVSHPNIRKRFLAEARNLAKMQHPNVVKVTDLIDAGEIVAFVMEHVDGISLEDYIKQYAPLLDEIIMHLFRQMVEAVNYVHSQGLIHRDIKPSNFMISEEGTVTLLDFGIAKNLNEDAIDYTKTGLMQQMGTPMYMSPEQVRNTTEITQQTDIYSLGVVLWQMVMNKKPYDADELTLPEIQVAILKENLSETKTKWDSIIEKATKKNIVERYQSVFDLKNEFRQSVVQEIKVFKPIKKVPEEVIKKLRSRRIIKPLLFFLTLIFVLLFFYFNVQGDESEVTIGTQVWMVENLDVITFRNGDTIPQALTGEEFSKAGLKRQPAWCYFENNRDNGLKYGKLYNWYAVNDPRGLAPEGYHIPTQKEWEILSDYLGGEKVAGKKMKSAIGWELNGNGTNSSGFGGLPGGLCLGGGMFIDLSTSGYWWSTTMVDSYTVYYCQLYYSHNGLNTDNIGKTIGMSVRCIKD